MYTKEQFYTLFRYMQEPFYVNIFTFGNKALQAATCKFRYCVQASLNSNVSAAIPES